MKVSKKKWWSVDYIVPEEKIASYLLTDTEFTSTSLNEQPLQTVLRFQWAGSCVVLTAFFLETCTLWQVQLLRISWISFIRNLFLLSINVSNIIESDLDSLSVVVCCLEFVYKLCVPQVFEFYTFSDMSLCVCKYIPCTNQCKLLKQVSCAFTVCAIWAFCVVIHRCYICLKLHNAYVSCVCLHSTLYTCIQG